jgi:hypothetical protein
VTQILLKVLYSHISPKSQTQQEHRYISTQILLKVLYFVLNNNTGHLVKVHIL